MTDALAESFEQQRGRLVAVAYRMLGSREDAEDAVQEAWLRLTRQDAAAIGNLAGWLTTVVGRVCIDVLRARRAHPEASYDDSLPEVVVVEDDAAPEQDAVLADSIGTALLVVLDNLAPAERLAFVLHDMFAVPFDEIGEILGRSADASKMLASRARRKVRGGHSSGAARQRQREVVDAFLAAARAGDFDGLLRVLDPQVTWRSYGPRGLMVRVGADEVVNQARRGARAAVTLRPALVNGEPGFLAWGPTGTLLGVMACTVEDGRIVELLSVHDPKLLTGVTSAPPSSSKE